MKRASTLVAACAALGILVMSGSAIAAYNAPRDARKVYVEMVTAYNQCTAPSLTHRPPLANAACAPTQSSANNPTNIYTFGHPQAARSGWAAVTLTPTRGDVRLTVNSQAIWKNGSAYSGNDLQGTATIRTTDNGCGAAIDVDCTIVDFPFPVGLSCTNGRCVSMGATANGILPGVIHEGDKAIIDIGQIAIRDEDGDTFARAGEFVGNSYRSPAFNAPKKALLMETTMVPAYNQCTAPTDTHRPALALPACAPTQSSANNPANTYTFGQTSGGSDDGSAKITMQRAPHRDDVRISVTSRSIWKNGADYTGTDLLMTAVVRATDDACGPLHDTDCTQVDYPFPVGLTCTSGRCTSVSPSWNAVIPQSVHREDKSNIEIGQTSIVDEDGDTVARSGLFVK
jgi:hypothetical protein